MPTDSSRSGPRSTSASAPTPVPSGHVGHAGAVASFTRHLQSIDKLAAPDEWAIVAFRLALAVAESPGDDALDRATRALSLLDAAAGILSASRAPVEHGRIRNAAGSMHRMAGRSRDAAQQFAAAVNVLTGRGAPMDEAAARSNLGLAQVELGRTAEAIETLTAAHTQLGLLPPSPQQRRALATALLNRAEAWRNDTSNSAESMRAAISDYEEGLALVDADSAPLQHAMLLHALGTAWTSLAAHEPGRASVHLGHAQRYLAEALRTFTPSSFPFHHGVAMHNLGLTHAADEGPDRPDRPDRASSQRRALVCFENAVTTFDPRLHREAWNESMRWLQQVHVALGTQRGRDEHFAELLGESTDAERTSLLRARLRRIGDRPQPYCDDMAATLASAVVGLPAPAHGAVVNAIVSVLMELPDTALVAMINGMVRVQAAMDPEDRLMAERVLDDAVHAQLHGPQRVRVRDLLEAQGWVRP